MPATPSAPIPRHPLSWRSWRFRAVAVMIALTLAGRLLWGWHTSRTLAAQLDDLRRRGEPVTAADFIIESVPDAENAWSLQSQAAAARAGVDSPRNGNVTVRFDPPYDPTWFKMADASEAANGPAFALARQARQLTRVQVRQRLPSPLANSFTMSLNGTRRLASTLADGAQRCEWHGDGAEAVERLRDAFHVARSLRHDEFLVSQLVAIGIDALTCNATMIVAPGLRFDAGQTPRPASREQVRALIAELLDERLAWARFEACLRMERVFMAELYETSARETWGIRPLADMEIVRANRTLDVEMAAARLRDKPAVDAALAGLRIEHDGEQMLRIFGASITLGGRPGVELPRYSRWFSLGSNDLSRAFERHFLVLAERRMTAVSLAAQLYRADHGAWPARLADLAPTYLPAVPLDPFFGDGRTLGYEIRKPAAPPGEDRPLVYTDGLDLPGLVSTAPLYDFQVVVPRSRSNGQRIRQYRDLSRLGPASAQAVGSDPKKSDAPRR